MSKGAIHAWESIEKLPQGDSWKASTKGKAILASASPSHCSSVGPATAVVGPAQTAPPMGEQQNRCTMEENKGAGTSFRVYVALCLMGITGWLPMKVLWIQIPILERNSPEGDRLPLYFLLLMETCSVATVAYLLARRCCRPRLSEVPLIYSSLAMSVSCLVLLGAFWEHDTPIRGQPHSFVLLLATLLAALVSSVATVTYIPFAARLYPQYMTAMLLGEALSSLLPHILFLVQGAGRKPLCTITDSSPNYTMPVDQEGYAMQYNIRSSTVAPLLPIQLRYTVSVYFFIHAGVILLGALCFTTLRWHRRCLLEYRQPPIEQGEVELSGAEEEPWQCDGAYMLDDGSYSQTRLYHQHNATSNCDSQLADQLKDTPHPTSQSPRHNRVQIVTSEPAEGPSSSDCQYAKPHSFKVLLAILLWTATILAGPLSSIHSHACYPIGNNAFLMGALLTDAAAVMACLVTARCLTSGQSQVTIVIALTCLGSILLTYFVALITFSTETESHNSPLFGSAGELLATVAWIAVVGLFSFAKMSIGVESSEASPEAVMWYSCFLRLAVVLGALCVLKDISICRVYRLVNPCEK